VTSAEAQELLTAEFAVIERAIAFACRRYRFDPQDADDFAAIVKLKLVDDDYAVLRAYERRSSFATYISIVVQRVALDFRTHAWGKWHASAEAKRLGPLAVDLERLLQRDGRTLDDAHSILASRHDGVTRASLQTLSDQLPARAPRRRDVSLDEVVSLPAASHSDVEEPLLTEERRSASRRLSSMMTELIASLPGDDRLYLQMRFEGGMSVAQIARAFRIEQKLLYRRMDRCIRDLRKELVRSGVDESAVHDLIGHSEAFLDFELGIRDSRPSIPGEQSAAESGGGSE
jgi:RNA polymerase sigma factor (sigma-70 family)